ncbi:MAG: hypothetical protein NTX25_17825, partial [Proteobacteria bacterium]|nr:hypothetical protein [Pseudomonadota bacterium]
RLEGLGPLSIDFAYGSFVNEYVSGVQAQEFTNVFINKTEFSLNNSAFKTNLEIQQTKKTFANEQNQDSTAGIIAGLAYQRWGDEVFGAKLYNQLVLQSSKGYVAKTIMASAFSSDAFDSSKEPSKILVSWNGDWKAKQYGFYWLALFQDHMGKNPQFVKSEMVWQTLDGMLRPIYAVTPNITLGFELDRRSILKEGEGLRQNANSGTSDWATNGGATRWGGILSYNLDNKMFDYPSIGLYAGEIIKDRATSFFTSEPEARSTHFVRLYYEVKIN